MKKRILFTIVACFALGVLGGQVTSQGNFIIGSALGLSTAQSNISQSSSAGETSEKRPTSTQFNIAPSVGYFLIDRLAVGIRMDYTLNRVTETGADKVKDSDLLFGPFARYYFPIGKDIAFLLEGGFGFGNSNDQQRIGDDLQKINTNIFAFGIGPGLTIISTQSIGIEALIKYNYAQSDFDTLIGGVDASTRSETNQLDFSVGIQFYFRGVQKAEGAGFF